MQTGCLLSIGTEVELLKQIANRFHKGRFGKSEPDIVWRDENPEFHKSHYVCESLNDFEEPHYMIRWFESNMPFPHDHLDKWYKNAIP